MPSLGQAAGTAFNRPGMGLIPANLGNRQKQLDRAWAAVNRCCTDLDKYQVSKLVRLECVSCHLSHVSMQECVELMAGVRCDAGTDVAEGYRVRFVSSTCSRACPGSASNIVSYAAPPPLSVLSGAESCPSGGHSQKARYHLIHVLYCSGIHPQLHRHARTGASC